MWTWIIVFAAKNVFHYIFIKKGQRIVAKKVADRTTIVISLLAIFKAMVVMHQLIKGRARPGLSYVTHWIHSWPLKMQVLGNFLHDKSQIRPPSWQNPFPATPSFYSLWLFPPSQNFILFCKSLRWPLWKCCVIFIFLFFSDQCVRKILWTFFDRLDTRYICKLHKYNNQRLCTLYIEPNKSQYTELFNNTFTIDLCTTFFCSDSKMLILRLESTYLDVLST